MVICKYFQNGSCRFGTKCINEHFDVKSIIKSEVEAALKGSQWPLSCFGPFKEKPCIPNFIEDQSFEEVRYLCYEAKKQNCFPAFHQQFSQQVMDAHNKMKTLLTLSRDIIEALTNLYNSVDTKKPTRGGNPFSVTGNTNASQPSVFGNSQTQSNPFSNAGSSVLTSSLASNTSVFSGLGQGNFGSGFGTSQASLFGQQTSTFNQPTENLFSQPQQQSSVFGSNTKIQQSPFSNTTGFATLQTGLFSQVQQQQQPVVTGSNSFSAQSQQNSGFGLFSQNIPQSEQTSQLQQSSVFGSQPSSTGLFSQQTPQQNQSIFNSSQEQQNVFGQQYVQEQSAFGIQQSSNLLPAHTNQQPQNLSTYTFGNVNQTICKPQGTLVMSAFDNLKQQQQSRNLFGQVQQLNTNFQQTGALINSNLQITSAIPCNQLLYSEMEKLKVQDIEAFKADKFEIGKIPTNPPPKELVQFS